MSNQHKKFLTLTDLNEIWFLHGVCWEIKRIEGKHARGSPDHNISCLTVSSIHPALQMLQLPMNIKGKGLEILTPALPAPPNCVSTLCLPAAMHVVRYSRPSPSVSHFRILQLWWKTCKNMWTYFTRVVAVDNKVHFSKNSSINSKQAASLSSNMRTTSHHS